MNKVKWPLIYVVDFSFMPYYPNFFTHTQPWCNCLKWTYKVAQKFGMVFVERLNFVKY